MQVVKAEVGRTGKPLFIAGVPIRLIKVEGDEVVIATVNQIEETVADLMQYSEKLADKLADKGA